MTKKRKNKSNAGLMVGLLFMAFLVGVVYFGVIRGFKTTTVEYKCRVDGTTKPFTVTCKNNVTSQPVEPEAVYDMQRQLFYRKGNGVTIHWVDADGLPIYEPATLPADTNWNYNQKERRDIVRAASEGFAKQLARARNPDAITEEFVIAADLTEGVNSAYRNKLANVVKTLAEPIIARANNVRLRIFLITNRDNVQPGQFDLMVSSLSGVNTELFNDILPDSKELPSSSLTLGTWNLVSQLANERDKVKLIFFTDLQEIDERVSVFNDSVRNAIKDNKDNKIMQIVDKAAAIQAPPSIGDKLDKVVIVAMPTTNSTAFRQVQPYWVEVFARAGVNKEAIIFQL